MIIKSFLIIGLTLMCILSYAQEDFIPTKPDYISESDFRRGEMILKNARQQLIDDNYRITAADNWNFAVAYFTMGQPKELVYNFLFKSKYTNAEDFCEIIKSYHQIKDGIDNTDLFKLLGQDYKLLVQDCSELILQDTFDIDNYILKNNLNRDLVYRINNLLIKDQRFRKNLFNENTTDQQLLDKENILEAESILKEYGYPGLGIVGKKFDYVIWIVIQHAELHYQEKYLPLIALAVEQGELEKIPLKMLIDRIYHRKTGKQIFGSQAGIPFADDSTIEEVKLKYKL